MMARIALVVLAVTAFAILAAGRADAAPLGFAVRCDFDKVGKIDPIVSPGATSAHEHTFFGGRVYPRTTRTSLLHSGTTCQAKGDHSGYWAPTVIGKDGKRILPAESIAYWRPANVLDPANATQPTPKGLEIVTEHGAEYSWACVNGGGDGGTPYPYPRTCGDGARARLLVRFPDCANAATSPDHMSHMAYANGRTCPAGMHPVLGLKMVVRFHPGAKMSGAQLSSGRPNTVHADFMEAFRRGSLNNTMQKCVRDGSGCNVAQTTKALG